MMTRLIPSLRLRVLLFPWLMPLLATLLALAVRPWVSVAIIILLYLVAVLLTAVSTRVRPALMAALLSFLAYNFFLTEPYYSLQMLHREDILTGLMLILVALITGHLAGRLNEQVVALRASQDWNRQQMDFARDLSACAESSPLIALLASQLQDTLNWHVRPRAPSALSAGETVAASTVLCHEDKAGFTVVFGDKQAQAVAALRLSATEPVSHWHRERVATLVNLVQLAWERIQLGESLRLETLSREREELRSALLSSVSHDLRTPLATMIGSVSSLIDLADSLDDRQRAELLQNTLGEARRLDNYIQKLLDMTRLGHGELTLDRDWVGLDEIIGVVKKRCRPLLEKVALEVELPHTLPLLHVHAALIEQGLFNVIENAIRFSAPGATVTLHAECDDDCLDIDVKDQGPGIAPDDWERVFDMFHTFSHGDQYSAGTGLGLPISRSIFAAHGGNARVLSSTADRGTCIRLSLPVDSQAQKVEEE